MKTVMVSGGFDPIHGGHVQMIRDAANHGDVIVVANSDEWLMRKKGYVFMSFEERVKILREIKGVVLVAAVDDSDDTVCNAIRMIRPDYFQIVSRLLSDYLQITSRLLPYITARLLTDYFQITSRSHPDYFYDTSRLLPDCFQITSRLLLPDYFHL